MTLKELLVGFGTQVRSIWMIGLHAFAKRETRMYPEEPVYLPPRYRGRIVQLTPDFELGEYKRQDLVYEKEDLLISGPGKYPEYNFYRMAGMAIDGKDKGEAENEAKPIDVKSLLP